MNFARNIAASIVSVIGLVCIISVLVLACPLWIVSFLTRIFVYLRYPKYIPWNEILEFEPSIGWKPRPNLDTYYLCGNLYTQREDDICHIRTDSQGWIGAHSLAECDIVIFGDSFAFGYGVDLRDSYLSLNPNLKIKAIAAPGYNMVQELLLMRQYASQLTDKLVVWFICLENDLLDNLRPNSAHIYRTPFVRHVGGATEWEIVTSHVSPVKWPCPTLRSPYGDVFAQLFTTNPLSHFVYSSCHFLLKEGRDTCHQVGADLSILTIPQKNQLSQKGLETMASRLEDEKDFDPDLLDRRFGEMCDKLSLPYLSASKYLHSRDYKTYDLHWTTGGHRRVATLLMDLHQRWNDGITKQNSSPLL